MKLPVAPHRTRQAWLLGGSLQVRAQPRDESIALRSVHPCITGLSVTQAWYWTQVPVA